MQRRLSEEDAAFRQRMRDYFRTEYPADLRDKAASSAHLDPDDVRRSQAALAEAGMAVPGWPVPTTIGPA